MFSEFSFQTGKLNALNYLGLIKMAAIGARTILPFASEAAENIGKSLRGATPGLQTELSAAVAPSVLKQPPLQQYLAVAGQMAPGESATSQWFRSQLQSQLNPQDLVQTSKMRSVMPSQSRTVRPGQLQNRQTSAPTIPPKMRQ